MKKKIYQRLMNLDETVGILLLLFMVVILFVQVIKRYLLNDPLYWVEEISIVASIWVVFLGAGTAARRNLHIAIELIPYKNEKQRSIVTLISNLFIIVFFGFVFYGAFTLLVELEGVATPALQIPLSYVMVSFPLCAVVICFSYFNQCISCIRILMRDNKLTKMKTSRQDKLIKQTVEV